MELFDILKSMFGKPEVYKDTTRVEKKKNFFMIQRRLAIGHPLQANALNHIRINPEQSVDIWQSFINSKYKYAPKWLFISGAKKVKEKKEREINITAKEIQEYAKAYFLDIKSVNDSIKFFPKEMEEAIRNFKKSQ